MKFLSDGKEYRGSSAVEIVDALKRDAFGDGHEDVSLRQFLADSLAQFGDRIPRRELEVSDRLDAETLALSYLCLRDEFGLGELRDAVGEGAREG
ncbi:MAG TPA: hypothetical protein VFA21_06880 [Pyrinomonadaceae bacterium]|nr:hypothetical protein [Pyrinomonadaceae bacterium]